MEIRMNHLVTLQLLGVCGGRVGLYSDLYPYLFVIELQEQT